MTFQSEGAQISSYMTFEELYLNKLLHSIETRKEKIILQNIENNQVLLESQKRSISNWLSLLKEYKKVPITTSSSRELYEPSAALKHFWIGFFYEKTHVPFNIISTYNFTDFNLEAFRQACGKIIERHEILRTIAVFNESYQRIWLKILPEFDLSSLLNVIDITKEADKMAIVEQHLGAARHYIFEYDKPAFYFTVLNCGPGECFIIFNISHAIFDQFSKHVFEEEIKTFYNYYTLGTEVKLPNLDIQYKDFCSWEKCIQNEDMLAGFRGYWFSQNKNRFPEQNLSTYYSHAELTDFSYKESLKRRIEPYLKSCDENVLKAFYGIVAKAERTRTKSYRFAIHNGIFDSLTTLCREQSVSPFHIIVSVLNVLLYKETSTTDIVLGSIIALRDKKELKNLLGFFVNTILIRNHINGNKSFKELLTDVVIRVSLASFFKYYTMSKLLNDLNIPFNAINTICLNMGPAQPDEVLTDFSKKHFDNNALGYFDMDLHINQYANGIEFVCNYDFTIYSEVDIAKLFNTFISLMDQCTKHPEITVDNI